MHDYPGSAGHDIPPVVHSRGPGVVLRALAIDTVTEMCSVALSVEGRLLAGQEIVGNNHSQVVLDMVNGLLGEAGIALTELDLIINDVGPGSFTGIRIGMGVAQGLAYGADLPLLGVDSLATLARGAAGEKSEYLLPAIDARMGQVYWALYRQGEMPERSGELRLSDPAGIDALAHPVFGCGSGWGAYRDLMQTRVTVAGCAPERYPLAADGLQLGLKLPRSQWVGAGELLPVYLRNDVAKVSSRPSLVSQI